MECVSPRELQASFVETFDEKSDMQNILPTSKFRWR